MTPAEIESMSTALLKQTAAMHAKSARAQELIEEGRTKDAERLAREVMDFAVVSIDRYIDVLFSILRNRVRGMRS